MLGGALWAEVDKEDLKRALSGVGSSVTGVCSLRLAASEKQFTATGKISTGNTIITLGAFYLFPWSSPQELGKLVPRTRPHGSMRTADHNSKGHHAKWEINATKAPLTLGALESGTVKLEQVSGPASAERLAFVLRAFQKAHRCGNECK